MVLKFSFKVFNYTARVIKKLPGVSFVRVQQYTHFVAWSGCGCVCRVPHRPSLEAIHGRFLLEIIQFVDTCRVFYTKYSYEFIARMDFARWTQVGVVSKVVSLFFTGCRIVTKMSRYFVALNKFNRWIFGFRLFSLLKQRYSDTIMLHASNDVHSSVMFSCLFMANHQLGVFFVLFLSRRCHQDCNQWRQR